MSRGKPYLSPTQIGLYTKCGEAYKRRYLERDIIPPGVAALRGTSVHKGAEANYEQKIHTRRDLKPGQVVEIVADVFDRTIKHEDVWLSPEEQSTGKKIILGEAKDTATRLAALFASDVAPRYMPEHVEMEHKIVLPKSTHDLLGRIDLITEDGVIQDLKTRAKRSSDEDIHRDPQLTFYALTYQNKFGKAPKALVIDELVDTKVPSVHSVITDRRQVDYDALVHRINTVVKGIKAGVFAPAASGAWHCSSKWCGYYTTCPYISRRE